MIYHYVVLGAGRQGLALAYDLAKNCEAAKVTLSDADGAILSAGVERLRKLLPGSRCHLDPKICDVSNRAKVAETIAGAQVVLSAVPYRFNVELTDITIEAGASFNDLGGNTDVVRQQLARHGKAATHGVSIVPDCGLAPGLGNILAAYGCSIMEKPAHVHVRCGGLPEKPVGPLGYKLLFNFQGLINEYSGFGEFLREGQHARVSTLSEIEDIEFPAPVGRCEAAVTSGGTSTCAASFFGKLQTYDYKTVRYPGHWAMIRLLFELGCFEEKVTLRNGRTIEPKAVLRDLLEERLVFPEVTDITVLRTTVIGTHQGKPRRVQFDLFDRHDRATGFTAMERTTAFPTTLVAHLQARKLIASGAAPLEKCIPLQRYMDELKWHDIRVDRSET